MNFKLIFSIVMAGMTILFIMQNVPSVEVTFLFWTLSMSRALLMSLILSIGIILGWLLNSHFKRLKTVSMQNKPL